MDFCKFFGIDFPLIQAPMAGVQGSALAIAVSNAGGLGSLPCAMLSTEMLALELAKIREQTSRPYNVNFFCHTNPIFDNERDSLWRKFLLPYYEELGLSQINIVNGAGRIPFSREAAEILSIFKPPVVSFHFGLPEPELLALVRAWGGKIISSATTLEEAQYLEKNGVDAIIAQGKEAGGHRGMFLTSDLSTQISTENLVKQIVAVSKIPVIAAGGIASPADVQHLLNLGASAVQIGTAYLLADEAQTSALHRSAIAHEKQVTGRGTAITNLMTGRPARGIVNRLMSECGPISEQALAFPLAVAALAPLRAQAESLGRDDFTPLWAGENVAQCKALSAVQITKYLMSA